MWYFNLFNYLDAENSFCYLWSQFSSNPRWHLNIILSQGRGTVLRWTGIIWLLPPQSLTITSTSVRAVVWQLKLLSWPLFLVKANPEKALTALIWLNTGRRETYGYLGLGSGDWNGPCQERAIFTWPWPLRQYRVILLMCLCAGVSGCPPPLDH